VSIVPANPIQAGLEGGLLAPVLGQVAQVYEMFYSTACCSS
jgi:hypothetical protein